MGMYYNRARYYDVENGRFNGMDDWEGRMDENVTLNKYLYGNGNPATYIDPTGNTSSLFELQASMAGRNKKAAQKTSTTLKVIKRKKWNINLVESDSSQHTYVWARHLTKPKNSLGI